MGKVLRASCRVARAEEADKCTMCVRRVGCKEAQRRMREMAESSREEGREERKVE